MTTPLAEHKPFRENFSDAFQSKARKNEFRQQLERKIGVNLSPLSMEFDKYGILFIEQFMSTVQFETLLSRYEIAMTSEASATPLHTFLDLRKPKNHLYDLDILSPVLHPLLIAITAYRIGGPIRIVDARAKDSEPMHTTAQDNQLHCDNSPYSDEYKLILSWTKGTCKGPSGQNFVGLAGSHRTHREALSENAFSFDAQSVNVMLQNDLNKNLVLVEASYHNPISILFWSSAIIHHRYRTLEGSTRSSLTFAFHDVSANPGSLMGANAKSGNRLYDFLFCDTQDDFFEILALYKMEISRCASALQSNNSIIPARSLAMTEFQRVQWLSNYASAPSIDIFRPRITPSTIADPIALLNVTAGALIHDVHENLDLRFHPDGQDQQRKLARTTLREQSIDQILECLSIFLGPSRASISMASLQPDQICRILEEISSLVREQKPSGNEMRDNNAYSLLKLIIDLTEAVTRCVSTQTMRATYALSFLAAAQACRTLGLSTMPRERAGYLVRSLLGHYITVCALDDSRSLI